MVIVTSEGVRGVKRRLVAHRRALGLEGKRTPFFLVTVMPNLGAGPDDRAALEKAIKATLKDFGVPVRLIVIDTLRRATPGKSENKTEDMSIFVENCETLARAFNCLVVAVHHSPRSDDKRSSGSNSIDAAADVMVSIIRDEATRKATAEVVRYKDGEEGDTWSFELRQLELGTDRDGCPITSCYVDIIEEPARRAKPKVRAALTDKQRRVYDIVLEAINSAGVVGLPARQRRRPCVLLHARRSSNTPGRPAGGMPAMTRLTNRLIQTSIIASMTSPRKSFLASQSSMCGSLPNPADETLRGAMEMPGNYRKRPAAISTVSDARNGNFCLRNRRIVSVSSSRAVPGDALTVLSRCADAALAHRSLVNTVPTSDRQKPKACNHGSRSTAIQTAITVRCAIGPIAG